MIRIYKFKQFIIVFLSSNRNSGALLYKHGFAVMTLLAYLLELLLD